MFVVRNFIITINVVSHKGPKLLRICDEFCVNCCVGVYQIMSNLKQTVCIDEQHRDISNVYLIPGDDVSISTPYWMFEMQLLRSKIARLENYNYTCVKQFSYLKFKFSVEVTIIPKPGSNETLDLQLHAVDISSVSAVLSWDPVSSLKLQYVTGVLLEYQQHLVDLAWMSSGLLDVTTTSHQLHNLQPTREYLARLVLTVNMEGASRINLTSISLKTAEKGSGDRNCCGMGLRCSQYGNIESFNYIHNCLSHISNLGIIDRIIAFVIRRSFRLELSAHL